MTDLDVNYTICIIENITASLGTNNLFDVYSDPTRKLVDDVTTSYRLFSYLSFPVWFMRRYVDEKVSVS